MKLKVLYIISLIAIGLNIHANEADSVFVKANNAFTNSDYQSAITLYSQIIDEGYASAELYYNLGNAYFKENYLPKAILYYEKAKLLAPNDDAINFNLELANTFKVDQIEAIPEMFLKKWINNVSLLFASKWWGYISIGLFTLFVIFTITYLFTFKISLKKSSFIFGILTIALSILSFSMAHKRLSMLTNSKSAIIMTPSITIKSSPDISGTDLFVLHEGTKVSIEDQLSGWYEIRIADGNKGWVPTDHIEKI